MIEDAKTKINRIKNPVQKQQSSSWQLVVIVLLVVIICIIIVVLIWCRLKDILTRNNGEQSFVIKVHDKEENPELTLRGDEIVK